VKRGGRYRYSVSQSALNGSPERSLNAVRLPAQEMENRVTERLCAFLKSDAELFDGLSTSEKESPGIIRSLLTSAKKLADKFISVHTRESREALISFLRKVVIHNTEPIYLRLKSPSPGFACVLAIDYRPWQ
jgi:hypothetical protein